MVVREFRAHLAPCRSMEHIFIGSEAVAAGRVTKYDLRARHQRVLPDVYATRDMPLTLYDRTMAAWLWSRRKGVVSGLAAAALHRAKWVNDDAAIDLVLPKVRGPRGVQTHSDVLLAGECLELRGMLVTTAARTAFDLGCRLDQRHAVAALDALGNATGLRRDAIEAVADAHPGARNVRKLKSALSLYDAGAQSPQETWLRLLVVENGYPPPQTQTPVYLGGRHPRYYLDMAWPDRMIALEYDGAHHYLGPQQVRADIERLENLEESGWIVVRVVAGMRPAEILERLRRAWARRDRVQCERAS